jgi:plasmid stabilization system protein ParE
MRVELSAFIESDLDAIAEHIALDNPIRAVSFIQEIRAKFRLISQHPLIYRLRPEIGEAARMALTGRYVILFRLAGDVIRIERVADGARDLPGVYEEAL